MNLVLSKIPILTPKRSIAVKIALGYVVAAALWFLVTGIVFHIWLPSRGESTGWEIANVAFYMLVTGFLLGKTLDRYLRQLQELAAAIQDSERQYRHLFENMHTGFQYCRMVYEGNKPCDWVYLVVNNAFESLTGLHNVVGKRVTEVIPNIYESDPELFEIYGRVASTGIPEQFEYDLHSLEQWFTVSLYCPQPGYVVAVFDVITKQKQSEAALKAHEWQFRVFVEQSPAAIAMFDQEMRYLVYSRRWIEDYHLGDQPLLGRSHYEIFPEIPPRWREIHRRCLAGAVEKCEEDPFTRADGTTDWVRWEVQPWHQVDGAVGGIIIFSEDISARKRAEARLWESEERLRAIGDNLPDSYVFQYTLNPDETPRYLYLSAGLSTVRGLNPADVVRDASLLRRQLAAEQLDAMIAAECRSFRTLEDFEMELRVLRPDGQWRWLSLRARPRRTLDASVVWDGVATDITETRRAADALLENKARLEAALGSMTDALFITDLEGRLVEFNDAFVTFHKFRNRDECSRILADYPSFVEVFSEKGNPVSSEKWAVPAALGGKSGRNAVCVLRRKDTGESWVGSYSYAPIRDRNGSITGAVVAIRDVTEQKQAERALKIFRELVERSTDAIHVICAETGRFLDCNARAFMSLGMNREELLASTVMDITVGVDFAQFCATTAEIKTKGYATREAYHRRRDGSTYPVEVSLSFIKLDREYLLAVVRDITERKRAEEERARLAIALEQTVESVIITNADGRVNYVNPAFERMSGFRRSEVIGKSPRMLLKSGTFDVEFYRDLWKTLRDRLIWSGQLQNKRKDGTPYHIEMTVSPVLDEQNAVISFVGLVRDVSERADLERRLRQAQKLEALGTLAGGIAHDFNNILMAIQGYAQLIAGDLPEGSESKSDIGQLLLASQRAADLVRQILTFSRQVEDVRQCVDIRLIVKESLKLLRPSLPATIEIRADLGVDPLTVMADPTQIHQVVMNLCANAYHAMRNTGGVLSVSVQPYTVDRTLATLNPSLTEGEFIRLSVCDTGHGIPKENLDKIFDPFFTTKPVGEGTGLGLATVHGIVTAHGGAITVYSEVGSGTTFHIYLPCAVSEAAPHAAADAPVVGGNERILIVDDEPALAELLNRILKQLGYQVTAQTSPFEAQELFRAAPYQFDLVITDQTMPKITGAELVARLKQIRADIPAIITTGQMDGPLREQLAEVGVTAILPKPSQYKVIARTVRAALDNK